MHPSIIEWIGSSLNASEVGGRRVVEVGSQDVNGSPRAVLVALKPAEYVGVDVQSGRGVDVVCPAADLAAKFGAESFDLVLSTEMLEHVEDWKSAVSQLKRILRREGLLLVTTRAPGFPYHPFPIDMWRFTQSDFRRIFADMEILALVGDRQAPGVFLKARKPNNFKEIDLSEVKVSGVS